MAKSITKQMEKHLRRKEQDCADRKAGKTIERPTKKYWWEKINGEEGQ